MAIEYLTLPASGLKVAVDVVDTDNHTQVVKIGLGGDGVTPTLLAGGQQAKSASIPVTLPSDADALPTKDAGPNWTGSIGVSGARFTSSDQSASAASVTDAPTSTQKICIDDLIVSVDADMRVDFKEETSGTVLLSLYLPANSVQQVTPRGKLKLATADKKLQVQTSAAGNVSVTALYHSEA